MGRFAPSSGAAAEPRPRQHPALFPASILRFWKAADKRPLRAAAFPLCLSEINSEVENRYMLQSVLEAAK